MGTQKSLQNEIQKNYLFLVKNIKITESFLKFLVKEKVISLKDSNNLLKIDHKDWKSVKSQNRELLSLLEKVISEAEIESLLIALNLHNMKNIADKLKKCSIIPNSDFNEIIVFDVDKCLMHKKNLESENKHYCFIISNKENKKEIDESLITFFKKLDYEVITFEKEFRDLIFKLKELKIESLVLILVSEGEENHSYIYRDEFKYFTLDTIFSSIEPLEENYPITIFSFYEILGGPIQKMPMATISKNEDETDGQHPLYIPYSEKDKKKKHDLFIFLFQSYENSSFTLNLFLKTIIFTIHECRDEKFSFTSNKLIHNFSKVKKHLLMKNPNEKFLYPSTSSTKSDDKNVFYN